MSTFQFDPRGYAREKRKGERGWWTCQHCEHGARKIKNISHAPWCPQLLLFHPVRVTEKDMQFLAARNEMLDIAERAQIEHNRKLSHILLGEHTEMD